MKNLEELAEEFEENLERNLHKKTITLELHNWLGKNPEPARSWPIGSVNMDLGTHLGISMTMTNLENLSIRYSKRHQRND